MGWAPATVLLVGIGLLGISGCSRQDGPPAPPGSTVPAGKSVSTRRLPRLASAPTAPRLMQAYFNTVDGREWIYDGARWVPRDEGVDGRGDALVDRGAEGIGRSVQAALAVPFSPSGAHARHRAYDCAACHLVGGSPCLDPTGPAAASGKPSPAFDPAAKTCSNVSCHGAYSGTFTYTRWDYGLEEVEYVTVPYAGSGGAAGNWYTPGSTCTSCHGNPPSPTTAWHSPIHASSLATGRKCETCHPDAISAVVGGSTVGVAINATYAALHGNGIADVQARFTSKCFGCH
ncbi:MAG: hypothetical protein HZB56_09020 [Deltaproteobacteria bacterium]|nr:hypothetical protein [Deltaproteobacteria bacterium]